MKKKLSIFVCGILAIATLSMTACSQADSSNQTTSIEVATEVLLDSTSVG